MSHFGMESKDNIVKFDSLFFFLRKGILSPQIAAGFSSQTVALLDIGFLLANSLSYFKHLFCIKLLC